MHSISLHSISKSCLLIANGLLSYTLFCLLILRYSRVAFSTYIETRKGSISSKLKLSKLGGCISVMHLYALGYALSGWVSVFGKLIYIMCEYVIFMYMFMCSGEHWMSSCKCKTLYSHFMLYEIINFNINHYIRIGLGRNDYRVLYYVILLKKILVWNLLWMQWKSVFSDLCFFRAFYFNTILTNDGNNVQIFNILCIRLHLISFQIEFALNLVKLEFNWIQIWFQWIWIPLNVFKFNSIEFYLN